MSQFKGWTGACEQCGVEIRKPRCHAARVKHHYCSVACHDKAQTITPPKPCKICGNLFKVRGRMDRYSTCPTPECRADAKRGSNNGNWAGGVTPPRQRDMSWARYRNWRKAVLERDGRVCVNCGARERVMHADHIKEYAKYPELRYEVSNGRTLCPECHRDTWRKIKIMIKGYIAVDLDGTLAHYDSWIHWSHIGEPVPAMLQRVRTWIQQGKEVRIMTARVSPQALAMSNVSLAEVEAVIKAWCLKYLGFELAVTCQKDMAMISLWDDRAITVEMNTGRVLSGT